MRCDRIIGRLIQRFLRPFSAKTGWQDCFEILHEVALAGMNYGGGTNLEDSGERAALAYVHDRLRQRASAPYVLFDVGANRGSYTRLLSEIFGNEGLIYAFEPSHATFSTLKQEIVGLAQIRNFGFSDRSGTCTLYFDVEQSGLASLYDRNLKHFNIDLNRTEEVLITTVDAFCQAENIRHIHMLKLDVEGHEIRVLDGARQMFECNAIDFVQFEFGGCNIDSKTYFRDFYYTLTPRYQLFRIVKDGLREISAYREADEIFRPTNYLAALRYPSP